MDVLNAVKARMAAIDESLAEPVASTPSSSAGAGVSGTKPPPGLSGEEEVAWWKNKIADLSGDPTAESKENGPQNVTPFAASAKDTGCKSSHSGAKGGDVRAPARGYTSEAKGMGDAKSYRK